MMVEVTALYHTFLTLIGIAYVKVNEKPFLAFLLRNSVNSTMKLIKRCFVHLHSVLLPDSGVFPDHIVSEYGAVLAAVIGTYSAVSALAETTGHVLLH